MNTSTQSLPDTPEPGAAESLARTHRAAPHTDSGIEPESSTASPDEIRGQQHGVLQLIVQFQRSIATSGCDHALREIVGDLLDCVKANFSREERWVLERAPRRYREQCQVHRRVIEQLHVFHESLENGIELSEMDLKHGLDALLLHYLVNDRSRQSGGVDQRTANIRTASVHGST